MYECGVECLCGTRTNVVTTSPCRHPHSPPLQGESKICRLLIKHGAQYSVRDRNGLTPLHYASYQGWFAPLATCTCSCVSDVNAAPGSSS